MPPTSATGKTCVVCGQDCSAKPRVKDPKGRYFCKACHESAMKQAPAAHAPAIKPAAPKPAAPAKAAPARPAAPPAPTEPEPAFDSFDNDALLAGIESAPGVEACPGCGIPLPSDQVICMSCGHNRQSGRAGRISVVKAPKERRAAPRIPLSMSPGLHFLISMVIFGGLAALTLASPPFLLAFAVILVLYALVASIMMIVMPFKDGFTGWGIVAIASLVVPFIGVLMLYYVFFVNERGHLKALVGAYLLAVLMLVLVVLNLDIDLAAFEPTAP